VVGDTHLSMLTRGMVSLECHRIGMCQSKV
jgi:hypothetical protein